MTANYTSMFITTPDIGNLVIAMNSHVGNWIGHSILIIFFVVLILSFGSRSWNNFAVATFITFIVSIIIFGIGLVPSADMVILFIALLATTFMAYVTSKN